jgi:hypothetical protein
MSSSLLLSSNHFHRPHSQSTPNALYGGVQLATLMSSLIGDPSEINLPVCAANFIALRLHSTLLRSPTEHNSSQECVTRNFPETEPTVGRASPPQRPKFHSAPAAPKTEQAHQERLSDPRKNRLCCFISPKKSERLYIDGRSYDECDCDKGVDGPDQPD